MARLAGFGLPGHSPVVEPAACAVGDTILARTARYGSIKRGQLFKVGKRGALVSPRNLIEAEFVAVQGRSTLDISRSVKVKRYRRASRPVGDSTE